MKLYVVVRRLHRYLYILQLTLFFSVHIYQNAHIPKDLCGVGRLAFTLVSLFFFFVSRTTSVAAPRRFRSYDIVYLMIDCRHLMVDHLVLAGMLD